MTKRTGRPSGMPPLRRGERTIILQFKVPEGMKARMDRRARDMGMTTSKWLRLVIDNALLKVPLEPTEASRFLAEALLSESVRLDDVHRAARDVRIKRGPPRVLP